MYGIYITSERLKNGQEIDYIELIMQKLKSLETRNKDTLKALMGKRVALIDRAHKHNGKLLIRGFATIASSTTIDSKSQYERLQYAHLVPPSSCYWWDECTKKKVMYKLTEPERALFELPELRTNHGRSYTEFDELAIVDFMTVKNN